MTLRKRTRKGISILKLTAIYAVLTAAAVFIAVSFINSSIVVDTSAFAGSDSRPQSAGAESTAPAVANTSEGGDIQKPGAPPALRGIPSDASFLQFSSDGQYCVYCFKGKLYVMDIPTGKIVKQIPENDPVTYAVLMYDRNIVIYFTEGNVLNRNKAGSSAEIAVVTYNMDTGVRTVQRSLKTGGGAKIRQADYSSMTGHVSFDVYSGNSDVIYYIDLMKNLIKIPVGGPIRKMVLTNSRQAIYYERGDTLYYQSKPLQSLGNIRAKLLGCDLKDYVYVQSRSDQTLVYVVKGTAVVKKIRLDDTGFTNVYSNKTDIYLVYPGYLLDLSSDPAKKTAYDKAYGFKGLIGNYIYLSDKNNDIILKTIA